jgi:hypothetical protein
MRLINIELSCLCGLNSMLPNANIGFQLPGPYERLFCRDTSKNAPCGAFFNFLQTLKKLLASALLIPHQGQAM